ncbi:MAG: Ig-like domain-containing protein [Cytophagales bacterium]|nr:Ig-like domain-containing protein [Cytophagales bacterium]
MGIDQYTITTFRSINQRFLIWVVISVLLCFPVSAQYSELWGYGFKGGLHDLGFVYKTNNHGGQLQIVHHFSGEEGGQYPNGDLVQGPDGLIYGTASGGSYGLGMIFRINPHDSELEIVYHFDEEHPSGSMILASDGKLYGYTSGIGEIYAFDLEAEMYEVIHAFNITDGKVGVTATKMIEVTSNVLYGVTVLGGVENGGLIFRYDINEAKYEIVYEFDGQHGSKPGNIELFSDGKLYGIADGGREFDKRLIFQFDPETGTVRTIHEFGATYHLVLSALLEASNGKFYGVATIGGFDAHGAIWEYDPATDEAVFIKEFTFASGIHIPDAPLMEAFDNNIYGTTRYGGTSPGLGTIFQYNPEEETFNYVSNLGGGFPTGNALLEVGERTVDEITLHAERNYLEVGEQMQLSAYLLPEDTQGQAVVWSVDDPIIATVSKAGVLTAIRQGSVQVTATANFGLGVADSKSVSVFNVGQVLGVEANDPINVFPNPISDGKLWIKGLTQPATYKVTDLAGKVVAKGIVYTEELPISLVSGIYTIQVLTKETIFKRRVLVR